MNEEEEEDEVMRETEIAALEEVLGVTVALLAKAEKVRFQTGSFTSLP